MGRRKGDLLRSCSSSWQTEFSQRLIALSHESVAWRCCFVDLQPERLSCVNYTRETAACGCALLCVDNERALFSPDAVPPGDPVILDEDGKQLQGLVGPYNEGDPLTLTCQVEVGKTRGLAKEDDRAAVTHLTRANFR